jgi:hypothetical protein
MTYQLSLTEYSAKYKVSISTLRRRIKKDEVEHVQESGKYMLPDVPYDVLLQKDTAPHTGQSSFVEVSGNDTTAAPPQKRQLNGDKNDDGAYLRPLGLDLSFVGQPKNEYASSTAKSDYVASPELIELKKAYTKVLSEKESQLLQLKQHIVDLQTLNKALENEADRLNTELLGPMKTSFSKYDF